MSKKFIVSKREVHVQMVSVEAEDEEDAIDKVIAGHGEMIDNTLEYSHDLDADCWEVEEA